jgi:hypothetical protein
MLTASGLEGYHLRSPKFGGPKSRAQVAELVDALASGASGRKVVEVRVFSWAPLLKYFIS